MTDQNDTFQARLERTHCEQDWPCAMSGLAHELGDAYATLTEQVETLEADKETNYALIRRQGELLTRSVNLIRGEPAPLHLHSHHNLPELVEALRARVVTLEDLYESALRQIEHDRAALRAAQEGAR